MIRSDILTFIHKRKRHDFFISRLLLHAIVMQGLSQHSGRRAGFEPPHRKSVFVEFFRQIRRSSQAVRAAPECGITDKYFTSQKCSGAKNHRFRIVADEGAGDDTLNTSILNDKVDDLRLFQMKVRFFFDGLLHLQVVLCFIRLCPKGVYRRTLGGIQHLALKKGFVDVQSHLAAKRIDFAHQVSLSRSADGRIARHHGHGFQVDAQQQGVHSHARGNQTRLAAGMSGTYHDYIIFSHYRNGIFINLF